jgi:hypothetical protein
MIGAPLQAVNRGEPIRIRRRGWRSDWLAPGFDIARP